MTTASFPGGAMFTGPARQRCWMPASGQRSWGPRPQGDPVQEQGAKGPGIRADTLLPHPAFGQPDKGRFEVETLAGGEERGLAQGKDGGVCGQCWSPPEHHASLLAHLCLLSLSELPLPFPRHISFITGWQPPRGCSKD